MSTGHYKEYDPEPALGEGRNGHESSERVGLLSGSQHVLPTFAPDAGHGDLKAAVGNGASMQGYALKHLFASFAVGIAVCLAAQLSWSGMGCSTVQELIEGRAASADRPNAYAAPWVGSTVVDNYPPPSPTNEFPSLFPTEYVFSCFFACLLPLTPSSLSLCGVTVLDTQEQLRLVQNRASSPLHPPYPSKPGLQRSSRQPIPRCQSHHPNPRIRPSVIVRSICSALGATCRLGIASHKVHLGSTKVQSHLRNVTSKACTSCIAMGRGTLPVCPHLSTLRFLAVGGWVSASSWLTKYLFAAGSGPSSLAQKLHGSAGQWDATGPLEFLNDW